MSEPEQSPAAPPHPPPFVARARKAYVTGAIFAVNAAVMLAMLSPQPAVFGWIDELTQARSRVWHGEYWRLFTALFVHANVAHFGLNMMAHVIVGRILERIYGPARFVALYLGSGIMGSLLFQAIGTGEIGLGASGAIYGAFGAFLLLTRGRNARGEIRPGWRFFGNIAFFLLLDQVFARAIEGADIGIRLGVSAHAGGLIGGSALGFILLPPSPGVSRQKSARIFVAAALAAACITTAVYGCCFPVHDPQWEAETESIAFEGLVEEGRFDEALDHWRTLKRMGARARRAGDVLYDGLMAMGRVDEAKEVLEDVLREAEQELAVAARRGPIPPDLLNTVAWFRALANRELEGALQLADEAVRAAEAEAKHAWAWLPGGHEARMVLGIYLNTRGWVLLGLGRSNAALKDLAEAVEAAPIGPNFLYLAIAQDRLGNEKEARTAALEAEVARGQLSRYEQKLLEELSAALKR